MNENILFVIQRIKEKLWFRPVIFCILSILGALVAQLADSTRLHELVPEIKNESLSELLNVIAASMLVIATFTVGSMLSAFAAASNTATPRSLKLIITDDVSQNALSVFIGSFIFSIVALVALKNGYYGKAGLFTLFVFTLLFFSLVILTFLRWVERISRLGRMGHTIKVIEDATANAINNRLTSPTLHGIKVNQNQEKAIPIYSELTGYVVKINMAELQKIAAKIDAVFTINALPGKFISLDQPLLYIVSQTSNTAVVDYQTLKKAFTVSHMRYFDEDPRFGLITLSEIASRALSPAVNDPGTAIQIISSHVRLFTLWNITVNTAPLNKVLYDRIAVPELVISDLFEDAFRPIARDGAANIEVMIRLQKAFCSLTNIAQKDIQAACSHNSIQAFERAKTVMKLEADILLLEKESLFTKQFKQSALL
ncbi:DUF2254 domain-containing protein [Flavobacterium sp. PL002]|uniref:DUF2254 domain-containing protein n=1 Tax=Flavobacterium sp. PL002 TaxID=1897058 RepID=UPI001787803E|nr:DUF2254 domain-containing protein [Flavobacterium sp. PL002]MBE0392295.1 hypothetical protein [Flavobacterium sp. PL002]